MDVRSLEREGRVVEEKRGGAACGHVQIMWLIVSGRISDGLGAAALEEKSNKYYNNEEYHGLKLQQEAVTSQLLFEAERWVPWSKTISNSGQLWHPACFQLSFMPL